MQLHKHSNNNSPVHLEAKTKLPGKKLNVSIFQEISCGGVVGWCCCWKSPQGDSRVEGQLREKSSLLVLGRSPVHIYTFPGNFHFTFGLFFFFFLRRVVGEVGWWGSNHKLGSWDTTKRILLPLAYHLNFG